MKKEGDIINFNAFIEQKLHNSMKNEHMGYRYDIPKSKEHAPYRFGDLKINSVSRGHLDTAGLGEQLVLKKGIPSITLDITLQGVKKSHTHSSEVDIQLALFRWEHPQPLYRIDLPAWKEEIKVPLTGTEGLPQLKAGTYLLYIGNAKPIGTCESRFVGLGNGYAFHFAVMEHRTQRPYLSVREAFIDPSRCFHLSLSRPLEKWKDLITCECFDESYRRVGYSSYMYLENIGMDVTLFQRAEPWWADGLYHVLFYHNREPLALYSFRWEDDNPEPMKREALTNDSEHYQLTHIIREIPMGLDFGKLTGCREVKRQLLRQLSERRPVEAKPYRVIGERAMEEATIRTLTTLLYPQRPFRVVDCEKLNRQVQQGTNLTYIKESFEGGFIVVLHNLHHLLSKEMQALTEILVQYACYMDGVTVFYGSEQVLSSLETQQPLLKDSWSPDAVWRMEPYTMAERLRMAYLYLDSLGLNLSYNARLRLIGIFREHQEDMDSWDEADIRQWLRNRVVRQQRQRVSTMVEPQIPEFYNRIEWLDVKW